MAREKNFAPQRAGASPEEAEGGPLPLADLPKKTADSPVDLLVDRPLGAADRARGREHQPPGEGDSWGEVEGEGEEGGNRGRVCEDQFFDCIQLGALDRAFNAQGLRTRGAAQRITAVADGRSQQ